MKCESREGRTKRGGSAFALRLRSGRPEQGRRTAEPALQVGER
jgi:hypothetical protein